MSPISTAAGSAALSICESLLLSLTDLAVIGQQEAVSILKDAAAAHRGAITGSEHPQSRQGALRVRNLGGVRNPVF